MYDVMINDISCYKLGIFAVERPSFPAPLKKYKEYEIPGKDGKLYQDLEVYDDIEVTIKFNYLTNKDKWHEIFRKCKKLFLSAKTLQLSDDVEYYHKIKKVEIGVNERNLYKIGKFEVVFTLDPYFYRIDGNKEYEISRIKYNRFETAKPIYKIKGEGVCYLKINGKNVKCNIGQNLTIDTDLRLCYREDKTLQNTAINADYDDLILKQGNNEISITSGYDLKVIPNWRCI